MLVLSRKLNERVIIGNDITISVLGIHRFYVKLGFDAPSGVSVHREEIYKKIPKVDESKKTLHLVMDGR